MLDEYIKAANNFYRWCLEGNSDFIRKVWPENKAEKLEIEWGKAEEASKRGLIGHKEAFILRLSPADRTKLFRWVMENVDLYNIGIEWE